ncbi:MAG: chromate transporter [bacterium]
MMDQLDLFIELFVEFFKIGLFSIGGGAATIPFLEDLVVTKGWFSYSELLNFIAIAESTPGAIGVNMATFAGFLTVSGTTVEKILGAIAATLGLVTPSVIIIIFISFWLDKFKQSKIVQYIFYGLRPASVALITAALYTLAYPLIINTVDTSSGFNILELVNIKNALIAVVLGIMIFKHKMHPLFYIALSAVIGIMLKL